MTTTPDQDDLALLTTRGMAELTGIPEGTWRAWRARSVGVASFRLNGVVVYKRSDVEAWIRESMAAESDRRATARPAKN